MIIEALLLWPRAKGVLETQLADGELVTANAGMNG